MKNLNFPLFSFMMLMGILITVNSSSWLSAWLGMELNILGFLPMIMINNNSFSNEIIMKYFLISSISSMMVLYFSFLNLSHWNIFNVKPDEILITLALGLKLGCSPFHYWFISFMNFMKPQFSFLLMTFQKLPPLFLLNFLNSYFFMMLFIISSSIVGSIGGFNQTIVLKLLAYSSISHLSWMLMCIMLVNSYWFIYFISYSILLIPILFFIYYYNFFMINLSMNINYLPNFFFCLSLLSLGGLPPLMGFFPKLFIINFLYNYKFYFIMIFLIMSSIINLYYYLRLSYNYFFSYKMSFPIMNYYSSLMYSYIFIFISPLLFMMM